jgi:hypothetical protein
MPITNPHPVVDCKSGLHQIRTGLPYAPGENRSRQRELPAGALLQFFEPHPAGFDQTGRHRGDPALVIAGGEIVTRIHALDGVAELSTTAQSHDERGHGHTERPLLPRQVKYRFIRLDQDGTEAVHAAQVMDAIRASQHYWRRPPTAVTQGSVTPGSVVGGTVAGGRVTGGTVTGGTVTGGTVT